MGVTISRAVHDALLAAAAEQPDIEVCGLLYGVNTAITAHEVTANVARDPARHFEVDPVVLLRANREARNGGWQIAGYFHSHPNGLAAPSGTDYENAESDGRIWAIVAAGGLTLWRRSPARFDAEAFVIVD
jgi:desampylase